MPKYVIEGELPGAGELSGEETIMTLPKIRIWPLMFVLLGTVAACTSQTSQEIEVTRVVEVEADLPAWLAVREATEAFVSIEAAEAADYEPITDCMEQAPDGAMGIHYANVALLEDPALDVEQPEVLMYQPLSDGRMELVGVEYLVPAPVWTEDEPPVLLGQEFEYLEDLDLYALHLWAWRNNPNGLYADWNPNVDCSAADTG